MQPPEQRPRDPAPEPSPDGAPDGGSSTEGLSRRRLLALLGLGAAAVATAGLLTPPARRHLHGSARAIYHRLGHPDLPAGEPGALEAGTENALKSAAEALLAPAVADGDLASADIALERYVEQFRWRARHLAGHRTVYRTFAERAEAAARQAGAEDFASWGLEARRRWLERSYPPGRLARTWAGVTDPDALRHRVWVVEEVLRLFARTDAWRLQGYRAWPGVPTGLEAYREPVGVGS